MGCSWSRAAHVMPATASAVYFGVRSGSAPVHMQGDALYVAQSGVPGAKEWQGFVHHVERDAVGVAAQAHVCAAPWRNGSARRGPLHHTPSLLALSDCYRACMAAQPAHSRMRLLRVRSITLSLPRTMPWPQVHLKFHDSFLRTNLLTATRFNVRFSIKRSTFVFMQVRAVTPA